MSTRKPFEDHVPMNAYAITASEAALLGQSSDDVYGLWEIDWWFNGQYPAWGPDERRAFLSKLVEQGLIDVHFGMMNAEHPPLPPHVAVIAVSDAKNWAPREPLEEPVWHVMTSDEGLAALLAFKE